MKVGGSAVVSCFSFLVHSLPASSTLFIPLSYSSPCIIHTAILYKPTLAESYFLHYPCDLCCQCTGVVGYLEALRCYLRKVGSPLQSVGSGKEVDQVANTSSGRDQGLEQGGSETGPGGEEVIGIYEVSLCLSESLFRLITALG